MPEPDHFNPYQHLRLLQRRPQQQPNLSSAAIFHTVQCAEATIDHVMSADCTAYGAIDLRGAPFDRVVVRGCPLDNKVVRMEVYNEGKLIAKSKMEWIQYAHRLLHMPLFERALATYMRCYL